MDHPVAESRHLKGTAANLPLTWTDEFGEPIAPSGAVTVRVQNADGTDVVAAGSSTIAGSTVGTYTRALTAAQIPNTGLLTATWTDAGTSATRVTLHEIAGRFYFDQAAATRYDSAIGNYALSIFRDRRQETEDECEIITGQAWVPRYRRVLLDGSDDVALTLPDPIVRSVRTVRVYSNSTTYTSFTASELSELLVYSDGTIARPLGKQFLDGRQNIVVEYEHGFDRPPIDLMQATLVRLRDRITDPSSGVQDRAQSFTPTGGGTINFAHAGLYSTGIPDIDGVYRRYSRRETTIVCRNFDFDPTKFSLFHGARR